MVVPNGWEEKTIDDFPAQVVSGGTPSTFITEYWNGNILWMNSGELNLKRVYSVEGRITLAGLNNSSTSKLPVNSVLIGLAGQGKTRGTVAITYIELCTNQSIASILPNLEVFDSEFLYQNLNNRYNELRELSTGDGGRGGLNLTILRNLKVLLPPLPEQRQIATALLETDELITTLEKLIAKKRSVKQGTMQELLTEKRRLPGFNGEWIEKKFDDCLTVGHGQSQKEIQTPNGKYPILATSGEIGRTNYYLYDKPSVLIGRKGTIDKPQYMETPFWTIDTLFYTIINDNFSVKYIYYLFCMIDWNKYNEASGVPSLSATVIRNIVHLFPPTVVEQTAIAQILTDMDAEIDTLTNKLNKLRDIKQGMMSELLTGRIRLIETKQVDVTQTKVEEIKSKSEKEKTVKKTTGHNQAIEEAVMMTGIVNAFYSDKYPLGRKKVQKLMYLLNRHQGTSTSGFKEKAAGPYDEHLRYSIEPVAVRNKYIITKTSKKGTLFYKGEKINQAVGYIQNWEKSKNIQWLINQFKIKPIDELELLATVDRAKCVLLESQKPISMQTVKEYIQNSDEWKAKLKREIFSDENIARAIKWSDDLFGGNENAKN